MQGSTEMPLPGLVNFVPALDHYFCFNLPTSTPPSNLDYSVSLNELKPMSMYKIKNQSLFFHY